MGRLLVNRRRAIVRKAVIAVALAALLDGCAGVARVVPPPHSDPATVATHTLSGYHASWARVATIMEERLGFPLLDATLYLYPQQRALERALMEDGLPVGLAQQVASTLDAVGRPGKVLVNETAFRNLRWPQRVRVLSHELTHTAQYALAGGRRGTSEQWIREGFAEWVSWRVVEELKLGTLASQRGGAERRVLAARRSHDLPPLAELVTGQDLLAQLARHRLAPIYDQAFLAVDMLIADHGVPSVLDYFRRFGENADGTSNFEMAFGESLASFHARFKDHLVQHW